MFEHTDHSVCLQESRGVKSASLDCLRRVAVPGQTWYPNADFGGATLTTSIEGASNGTGVAAEILAADEAVISQDDVFLDGSSTEFLRPRRKRSKSSTTDSTEGSGVSSRERIIAAATELFIAHGYQGTGIQQLSKAAGLSRGALYHHIESKEELLFEISLSLLRPVTESARTIADRDIEPEAKFRILAQELVMHHAEHGDAWSVVLREAHLLSPEHYSIVIAARDDYEAVWTAMMDEGTAKGTWRKGDPVEIRGILGMMNSSARWMKPRGVLSPEQIATRYVDLILYGIKSPPSDA